MNTHQERFHEALRIARSETALLATREHVYVLYDVLVGRACRYCQLPIKGTSALPRLCQTCYEAQADAREMDL